MKIHFSAAIRTSLRGATMKGMSYLDINSGHLHRTVGGYPGPNHRMPVCCDALRDEMQPGDVILNQPPKGKWSPFDDPVHAAQNLHYLAEPFRGGKGAQDSGQLRFTATSLIAGRGIRSPADRL